MCWLTVAFSLLCAEILLSRAWELQSETLLCISCESYIFLIVTRMQTNTNLRKLLSELFGLPGYLSINPSIEYVLNCLHLCIVHQGSEAAWHIYPYMQVEVLQLGQCFLQMELQKLWSRVLNSCTGKAWRSSGNHIRTALLGNGNIGAKTPLFLLAFYVEMYISSLCLNATQRKRNTRQDDEGDDLYVG